MDGSVSGSACVFMLSRSLNSGENEIHSATSFQGNRPRPQFQTKSAISLYCMPMMVKLHLLPLLCIFLPPAQCQVDFNCSPLPPLAHPARNVHELRPQDIKVVMALGDSITAGESSVLTTISAHCIVSLCAFRIWDDGQSWD